MIRIQRRSLSDSGVWFRPVHQPEPPHDCAAYDADALLQIGRIVLVGFQRAP
jgi:hypothetical protein